MRIRIDAENEKDFQNLLLVLKNQGLESTVRVRSNKGRFVAIEYPNFSLAILSEF